MNLNQAGKALLIGAGVLAGLGLLALAASALKIPLGKLPGDWSWRRGNTRIFVPLGTSIVLSIVATIVLNLLLRRGR